ncbi:hypothetical protein D3Z36_13780 [Lachnospiraceae bacterium]|nr:hypothetical protein [Lachnospiraceae bacterium]
MAGGNKNTFNGFCKVVIRYAAISAFRERSRRRQREISFELVWLFGVYGSKNAPLFLVIWFDKSETVKFIPYQAFDRYGQATYNC